MGDLASGRGAGRADEGCGAWQAAAVSARRGSECAPPTAAGRFAEQRDATVTAADVERLQAGGGRHGWRALDGGTDVGGGL